MLIFLALRRGHRVTIVEISDAFGVSKHHVAKVVRFLGATGWLENVRGRGGGVRLARAPSEINIGDVVRLAERGDEPAECFSLTGPRCAFESDCRLRGLFMDAVDDFYASLARHTLEDVVANRAAIVRMLRLPKETFDARD